MPVTPAVGTCSGSTQTVFKAQGTANGPSKEQALDRARIQAQTLLDSYAYTLVKCPKECANVTAEADPDYDSAVPTYVPVPDASGIFVCTVELSRLVNVTCASDQPPPTSTP